jgi:hypothetical protein
MKVLFVTFTSLSSEVMVRRLCQSDHQDTISTASHQAPTIFYHPLNTKLFHNLPNTEPFPSNSSNPLPTSSNVRRRRHQGQEWLDRQGARQSASPPIPSHPLTRQKLTYLFVLIENSNVKFEYNVSAFSSRISTPSLTLNQTTPRPAGRSVIACQRMIDRLKGTLKNELEALKAGNPIEEGTPKKAASTPRKRKGKDAENNGDAEASPTKKGRKKKNAEVEKTPVEDDQEMKVKAEVEEVV